MTFLENKMSTLQQNELWQTQARGTNKSEYQLYVDLAGDKDGNDTTTGLPLKTFDEWMRS